MVFSVSLSDSPTHKVRVSVRTAGRGKNGGTARGGAQASAKRDFQSIKSSLRFEAGATGAALTQTVTVNVLGDLNVEPDETFTLRVTKLVTQDTRVGFAGGGARVEATGTILNDDQQPGFVGASGDEEYQLQQSPTPDPEEEYQLQSTSTSVVVSPSTLSLSEGGGGRYTIQLAGAEPTGTVTVNILSDMGGEAEKKASWTFNPGEGWDNPVPITVWGLVDDENEGVSYNITHTVSAAGTNFASATAGSVAVTVVDTTATLTLATDPATVAEGADISLAITSDVALVGVLPVELTLAARSSSSFTAADIPGALKQIYMADFGATGGTTGTVTIPTSRDTATSEGAEAYSITLTEAKTHPSGSLTNNGYKLGTDTTANGTLNDAASGTTTTTTQPKGVTVTPTTLTVPEGKTAFYSIVLNAAPTGSNTDVLVTYSITQNDDAAFTGGSMRFTTSNWNVPRYVRVWTLEDDDQNNDSLTFTHSISGGGYNPVSTSVSNVSITIDDNDD